ncbi:MAG TPA: hypothetical protein PK264_03505 [Hyphomicrobiaceae bacterium]|nr:hypothetical protein [Hyphomicrobiaceae bacterium]
MIGPRVVFALLVVMIAVAGCGRAAPDAGEARLCRSVIPALEVISARPQRERVRIIDERRIAGHAAVEITYRYVSEPPRIGRRITCTFERRVAAAEAQPRDLIEVRLEQRPMSAIRLHLLKRFWLEANASAAIDPEPIRGAARAPEIGPGLAFTLQQTLLTVPGIVNTALLAGAFALVYGLSNRINLAFGVMAIVGGYGALLGLLSTVGLAGATPAGLIVALAFAVWSASVTSAGTAAGLLVPLQRERSQIMLIAGLGLAIALEEFMRLIQGARVQWVPPIFNQPFALARADDFVVAATALSLLVIAVAALAIAVLVLLMRRSRFGRRWRAISDDELAAGMVGIDARRTAVATYALAGALAGVAGFLSTLLYGGVGASGGMLLALKALLAAVIGGIGSVGGAILGGMLLGVIEGLWSALLPIEHRDAAIFTLLVAALILFPGGLFDRRAREVRSA